MIQITRSGVVCDGPRRELLDLRAEARKHHVVVLPKLLAPDILSLVQPKLRRSEFVRRPDYSGHRLVYSNLVWDMALCFLLQDRRLCDAVSFIMDTPPLRPLYGKVTLKIPSSPSDPWHSDHRDGILVGLTISLGASRYRGGEIQMRRQDADVVQATATHREPGDGILIRISPELVHRCASLEKGSMRTVFIAHFIAAAGRRIAHPWGQALPAGAY